MRISDWSSDVCSSDRVWRWVRPCLSGRICHSKSYPVWLKYRLPPSHAASPRCESMLSERKCFFGGWKARSQSWLKAMRLLSRQERKSVEQGKSGSVRVEHGGRRLSKQKSVSIYDNSRKHDIKKANSRST